MIKLDATYVTCLGLKKFIILYYFLTFIVLPYSLKAMEDGGAVS